MFIDADWLQAANAGLIALAGHDSDVGRLLAAGRADAAYARAQAWRALFPDRLYMEVARVQRPNEEAFLTSALKLAATLDLPVVASNDVRFIKREDFEAHEARVCIHAGRVLADRATTRPSST